MKVCMYLCYVLKVYSFQMMSAFNVALHFMVMVIECVFGPDGISSMAL